MSNSFLKKLIKNRLINIKDYIINNYVRLGLDEVEAMLLLHIYNLAEKGEEFLVINAIKDKMAISYVKCADLVYKLVQQNLMSFVIETDANGKTKEKFTLDPMYNKILNDLIQDKEKQQSVEDNNSISSIVEMVETEFGRTISGLEIELITTWINVNRFSISLIKAALKEAILSKAYNLKYVDRILLNWQQNNIDTPLKAEEYTKTFKRFEGSRKDTKNTEEAYVSWMK